MEQGYSFTYMLLSLTCRPLRDRPPFGMKARTFSTSEIPFCQALAKPSIDGPSFWKMVCPFNHTLRTHFSGFLESVAGMGWTEGRTILQTDGPSVASSIE
ncbi:hypothetical protein HAX54_019247 [Datura stramonium]|uniref:Uncharacterized protein n=1 Tax=Datura stramonium TaxID=4076 RepID=A0ABS8UNY4_DATST|nr:hypothetical protein [Datura stramonium]